jgi:hypothetical protein
MMTALIYLAVLALVVAVLAALSRPRTISEDEYEEMKGKTSMVGNAMHALQEILAPEQAEALRKAKVEQQEEADPGGDPPDPAGRTGGSGKGRD